MVVASPVHAPEAAHAAAVAEPAVPGQDVVEADRVPDTGQPPVEAELARTTELLRAIIDSSPFATMAFDDEHNLLVWSAGAERLFGWTADEVVGGQLPAEIMPSEDQAPTDGDLVMRRTRDGRELAMEIHASPLRNPDGETIGYAGHLVDVTRLLEVERDLALVGRIGTTLAGAVGRMLPDDTLAGAAQAICDELRRVPSVDFAAVGVFIGSDAIVLATNTEPGIPIRAGDRLPADRGARLLERAAAGPYAEAWAAEPGDGAWGEAMTAAGLHAFAVGPIVHGGHVDGGVVVGTCDLGFAQTLIEKWASLIDVGTTPSALLADRLHAHREEHEVRAAIVETLDSEAFSPVYQPIVELSTGDVVGHEALTRFDSGRRPDLVFADARAVGLGVDLELATLRSALHELRHLPVGPWLNVNVSPWVFEYPGALREVLETTDRPVVLEITEHDVVGNYDALRATVNTLGPGVRLAVDDAGAGVANFGHIIDIGPDFVKLDHSLIQGVHDHLGRQALIVGMQYFSRASGCRLVAEGIETEDEARALAGLGVEFGQGYWFGRPVPVVPGRGAAMGSGAPIR